MNLAIYNTELQTLQEMISVLFGGGVFVGLLYTVRLG